MTVDACMYSSASCEWATPRRFFEKLDAEFHFDLDVCSTDENAQCRRHFTRADDALKQAWSGACWMNPPYGRTVGAWMRKAYESSLSGATVVCLLPARTDARWFHRWVWGKAEVRFIPGRLRFVTPGKRRTTSAPFPSLVAIYRPPSTKESPCSR